MGMEALEPTWKKPGRVAGPTTQKFNVLIEPELAEWAKHQPGGLSEMVRRLLKQEREAREKKP